MIEMSPKPVRMLSTEDLGIPTLEFGTPNAEGDHLAHDTAPSIDDEALPDDDPVLNDVQLAIALGFAGVILVGPPGTSKSWYARKIALELAGDSEAIALTQFHSSYQYEDFIEGFTADDDGNFKRVSKVLPLLCRRAGSNPEVNHVLVIDEISRCDAARVFGEALTYIEVDKREIEFQLASGNALSIPKNLIILGTMNPWDKGVDEVDVALLRRFAQIELPPDRMLLERILTRRGATKEFVNRIGSFFQEVLSLDDEFCHLGHAYFIRCVDLESSESVWKFSLAPFFQRACRFDPSVYERISRRWRELVASDADNEL